LENDCSEVPLVLKSVKIGGEMLKWGMWRLLVEIKNPRKIKLRGCKADGKSRLVGGW